MSGMVEQCAKRVEQALGETGRLNILSLSEYLGERSVVAYQALGWLAREGRIRYAQISGQTYVSLSEAGQGEYRKSLATREPADR